MILDVLSSRPYIVYMLKDSDVMDDWTAIKMAINIQRHKSIAKGAHLIAWVARMICIK